MASIGDLAMYVTADTGPAERKLRGFGSVLNILESKVGRFARALTDVAKIAAGVAAGGALADALQLPGNLVADSVKMAAAWEKSATSFEVLLGGAGKAERMMRDLRDFAAESPLGLSDATNEATKLLAAGVAQQQVVPTLRVLSDLAMGDREKFARASLAYTQVRGTGHVQGDELNQLRELGIPISAEIAKVKGVTEDALAGLQRAGQVTFPDLQRAMQAMTSEGGLFFRMTERGADTLDGKFARLLDAVDETKRAFGAAIVEEAGLKAAADDAARFADEMRGFVDDLRPAIRFAADVGKGIAQITGELARNGPLFVRVFSDTFREANPNAARLLDNVQTLVEAAKNFRLDPDKTIDAAFDTARAFGAAFDRTIGDIGDGLKAVYDERIKPIVEAIETAGGMWRAMADPVKRANRDMENMGFTEAQFDRRTKDDPVMTATAERLARLAHAYKGMDPASPEAAAEKDKYQKLNLAYHNVLTRQRDADLAEQAVLLHEFGKKSAGDIGAARKDRDRLAALAQVARFDLEKALFPGGGPAERFFSAMEKEKERMKEAVRTTARGGGRVDAMAAVLGGSVGVKPAFQPDAPSAAASMLNQRLAPSAEYGSQEFVRLIQQATGGGQDVPRQMLASEKRQETQLEEVKALLNRVIQAITGVAPVKLEGGL